MEVATWNEPPGRAIVQTLVAVARFLFISLTIFFFFFFIIGRPLASAGR